MPSVTLTLVLSIFLTFAASASAQSLTPYAYNIGSPSVVDYYIDPANGSDDNSGLSTSSPWRTVQKAWGEIPNSTTLSQGYRFNLMNGNYGSDELPNYWELKRGTFAHPIILRAATGQTAVKFVRDINMANVSYFYLVNIDITPAPAGDAFHCESCDHILLRGCTLNGGSTSGGAHETVKINQSQYVYLENNNISNADDNNIDFVAVQYGHIIGNKVSNAQDWCAYVKGGSAYLRIESNEFSNCGTGGFTIGQGSGFQFMTSPWIHYEAYDVKFINNVVHDTEGAAFGVNGGYNALIAHNTAYRVGTRSHLVEVVFGERTCDGTTNGASDATCAALNALGGWGPGQVRLSPDPVGNRNVMILNNIIYNPSGVTAPQHFAIYGPRTPVSGANLSSPQRSDTNVRISGNIIWNGTGSTPLGIEDSEQGCQDSNSTCNAARLAADNTINSLEPGLSAPSSDDFRPSSSSNVLSVTPAALSNFSGGDREASPLAAEGNLSNSLARDFSGRASSGARVIGAFDSSQSALTPPAIDDSTTPSDPPAASVPSLGRIRVTAKVSGAKASILVKAPISSSVPLTSVLAEVKKGTKTLKNIRLRVSGSRYQGTGLVKAKRGNRLSITVTATNSAGSTSSTVNAKVR
jgi:hypothetical protein